MDEIDETVLNIQQRQKRGLIMRRYKAKIERAKELSQKRLAPEKNIKKRAYAQARQIIRKRVAGARGAEYEKLGPSEKMAIDRAIDKKAKAIKKLALRLIPRVKQAEQKRLHTFMKGQAIHNFGKPEGHHTEPSASPGSAVSEELNALFAEAFTSNETEVDQSGDAQDVQLKNKKKTNGKNGAVKIYNKFGEEREQNTMNYQALIKKSEKSGVDLDILGEVYNRGLDAWDESYNVSPTQYAFARVNSFINKGKTYYTEDADLHDEELVEKRGLWDNIHAKRKRIKAGSGERMRKPGSKGAPTAQDFRDASESVQIEEENKYSVHRGTKGWYVNQHTSNGVWNHSVQTGYHPTKQKAVNWAKNHAGDRKHSITINEGFEQIDELSTPLLHSYLDKAKKTTPMQKQRKVRGSDPAEHNEAERKRVQRNNYMKTATKNISKKYASEETEIEESNNKPYVKPHIEKGSTQQSGWKASNKHGRVKYFGMDFKKSAEKHAGIEEESDLYAKIQAKRAALRANPEPEKEPPYKKKPALTAHDRDRRRLDREDDEAQSQIRKRFRKEETELEEGIKEKIKGAIRREKTKDLPLVQTRRDYATNKAGEAYEKGETRKGNQYSAWAERDRKKAGDRSTNPTGKYRTKTSDYNEEVEAAGTQVRKKLEKVDRPPKTDGVYSKHAEIKNKIIDEEGNVENDPKKRLIGTDSLVKAFKKDTPGQDINESFNIALAAGVGVTLTAADLGMRAQGGFALHPSVVAEMEARNEIVEEDVDSNSNVHSAAKKPVYVPPRRKNDGTYTPAKTVLRKTGKKILKVEKPEDEDDDSHDGQ